MVMGGDVCSVTKQVGGTAAAFVCVCVCVHACVCTCVHVNACSSQSCPNLVTMKELAGS